LVADQNGRVHSQVAELLSAYIDDEVNADERTLVEAHLATCAACAQDLTTLRGTVALVGQLPQVAAPRPFTVRESDVRPVRDTARPAWWRLPWAQGLVGAVAVLLLVVVVSGVVVLGRGGMVGAPAAPVPVAMEAGPAAEEAADERMVEEEPEMLLEAEKEVGQALDSAAPPPAPAVEEDTAELEMAAEDAAEAPAEAAAEEGAEAAPVEEKMAPDAGDALMATQPARAASGMSATPAPMPTATPAPMATTTPPPAAEAAPAAPSPTPILLEAEDLILEIEPGIIRARGRLPLPEGRTLLAVLWRDGQPIEWATIESRRLVVEADGEFFLLLIAQTDVPDLDLLAAEPAYYEIRIRPVDPPAPVEIRIPLDIHDVPPPTPTSTS
jgi:hypothetical protein